MEERDKSIASGYAVGGFIASGSSEYKVLLQIRGRQ